MKSNSITDSGSMSSPDNMRSLSITFIGVIQEWIETAQELGRDIPTPKGRLLYT